MKSPTSGWRWSFGLRMDRDRDERRPARQKVALEPRAGVLLEGSRWHPLGTAGKRIGTALSSRHSCRYFHSDCYFSPLQGKSSRAETAVSHTCGQPVPSEG